MAEVQLVIVDGPNAGRDFDVAGSLVVGRGEKAGIVLDDGEASRRHASLSSTGDSVLVDDLGSTNGTFVNGERIAGATAARDGDRIRIGQTTFEVRSLTQPTQFGTAISGEEADLQATAIGHAVQAEPEPEPIETQATAMGRVVPDTPPPGSPGAPPLAGAPGGAPAPEFPPPGGAAPPPGPPTSGFPPPPGPPAGFAAPGRPPAPYGSPSPAGFGAYPVEYEVDYPHHGIDRWRPFLHGIMAWPQAFVLIFVEIGAFFAFFAAWIAILVTGRYPCGLFDFEVGVMRWAARVTGFVYLFTDRYPPFSTADDPSYPVRLHVHYPEAGIARWRVFLQGFMAIPHFFVLWFVGIAGAFAFFIAWFAIVFTRRYPPGLFNFIVGWQRWTQRATAYALLMTEEYPPFALD